MGLGEREIDNTSEDRAYTMNNQTIKKRWRYPHHLLSEYHGPNTYLLTQVKAHVSLT